MLAHGRYWSTVAPRVRDRLRYWGARASAIPDPVLRGLATSKLRDEGANTDAIATLCTLAPARHRRVAVDSVVALQVMYDYLDAVSECPVGDPLRDGRQLFKAFAVALTPGHRRVAYYRHHPRSDDGGYLDGLVSCCRRSIGQLPHAAVVLPAARAVASRFSEAQTRSHAVAAEGSQQLEAWSASKAQETGLTWWEWAAGAAASILGVHALVVAACDSTTTRSTVARIDRAYLLGSALTTMLDSAVDDDGDAATGAHRYVAYYSSEDVAGERVADLARQALLAARCLPNPAHHAITVTGIAAFYLSARPARRWTCPIVTRVVDELRPAILPVLASLRVWRWLRGLAR